MTAKDIAMVKVMKFGGTSVQDAGKIRQICSIIKNESRNAKTAVVFSAMSGITDLLIESSKTAAAGSNRYMENIELLRTRQNEAVKDLLQKSMAEKVMAKIEEMIEELSNILHGIELVKECSPRSLDLVASFGERLNNFLIASYMQGEGEEAEYVDARDIIKTNNQYTRAVVNYDTSYPLIRERLSKIKGIPVVTGFIGSAEDGSTTTLGRNGSDFTASIIAAAIKADVIEKWTDVDGVLSADPRLVKTAFVVPEISVQEAMELSYFGAKVIHPYTMIPAVENSIPICIKNTENPQSPGTMIIKSPRPNDRPITGIASISNVSLINIEGGGMLGLHGFASRVFGVLAKYDVNIIMISQASSEHTICVVCLEEDSKRALKGLNENLKEEIETKRIQQLELIENLEIIAIIGENMRGTPGIAGKLFNTLGENSINVLAIAQGSSERNLSFVISKDETKKALNAIHKSFLG
ncbi:MAG: aspartate kinase [Spirochaetia bacterium]|nr:aspartate kinase [Spirochaetia bacterium]